MATQKKHRDYPLSETPAPYAYQSGPRTDNSENSEKYDKYGKISTSENVSGTYYRSSERNRDELNQELMKGGKANKDKAEFNRGSMKADTEMGHVYKRQHD